MTVCALIVTAFQTCTCPKEENNAAPSKRKFAAKDMVSSLTVFLHKPVAFAWILYPREDYVLVLHSCSFNVQCERHLHLIAESLDILIVPDLRRKFYSL